MALLRFMKTTDKKALPMPNVPLQDLTLSFYFLWVNSHNKRASRN